MVCRRTNDGSFFQKKEKGKSARRRVYKNANDGYISYFAKKKIIIIIIISPKSMIYKQKKTSSSSNIL